MARRTNGIGNQPSGCLRLMPLHAVYLGQNAVVPPPITPSNHPSHPQTLRRTIRSPISKFITYLKASSITGIKHPNLLKAMMNQSWSSCRHGRITQVSSIVQPSSAFSPQPLALSLHPSSIFHLPSSIFRMQPISQNM